MADDAIRIDTRIDTSSAEKDLEKLRSRLSSTAKEAQSGFSGADTAIKGMDTSTKGLTSSMSALGKVISGISIVAAARQLARGVTDVYQATEEANASLRKASTLFGDVAVDQQKLIGNLSSIAAETGSSISELGEAMYQAMSAGVAPTEDMADVLDVVAKSAKLAKGGFTETSKAIGASLSVINSYKMNISDLDKVQGILLQTQNKGVTTVDELGNALSKVTPTAAAFGLSFEEVATSLALVTKQGTSTDVAATALSSTLSELGKSGTTASKNLKEAADAAGLSADTFSGLLSEGYNLSEILTIMSDYAEANGLSMVDMFGSIEAGRATLQLSGKNLEDFNVILASMGDSAGLVQESFEKTISPVERLTASFNALKVKIGEELKPVTDSLFSSMSNVMDKMVGQKGSAQDLDTAIGNLSKALEDYAEAQVLAKAKTEGTSSAMEILAQDSVRTTLKSLGESWSAYSDKMDQAQASTKNYEAKFEQTSEKIKEYAVNNLKLLGEDVAEEAEGVEQAINELLTNMKNAKPGDGIWTYRNGDNTYMKNNVLEQIQLYYELQDSISAAKESQSAYEDQMASAAKVIAQYVVDGKLSMNEVYVYAEDMAGAVEEAMKGLTKTTQEVKKAGNAAVVTEKQITSSSTATANAVSSQSDALSEYIKQYGQINIQFRNLRTAGELLGESLYSPQDELETLKSLYVSWIKDVGTGSPTLEALRKRIEELGGAVDNLNSSLEMEGFNSSIDAVMAKFDALSGASDILGDSYYSMKSYLSDLEDLYAQGLVNGVDASSDSMQNLADEIEKVKEAVENAEKSTFSFTETTKTLGKDIAKGMLTSVSALFDEIFNKESKLKELTAELDELSLTEKENLDAVATAEADLADARARMNEKDIESAERKLDIAKSQLASTKAIISSVKDEKNAVENGSSGWKAYANTAMQALGSVLEALGHQLAAQAALNIISAPWASAGYAAGAVAAYAAASWAKAQKFAQGGIVGGSSYAGDNMLARVNSGELILNMAQQDNVAKALSTLAEMSGLTGSGGAGVSVYMAGSTIYGLDEPAVGKAIYDNIQQLHYEGVL